MRIQLLDGGGGVLSVLSGVASAQEADRHLAHYAGAVSWVEVDPTIVAAEIEEELVRNGLIRILLTDRFELENRIRALERHASGTSTPAAVTKEQFISAVKARCNCQKQP